MPEILTESFCERCGTRYTFQAAAAAGGPLTRVRTLSKGFRNYVLSDETSLSEAMATARSEDVRRTSGEQLDAFHKAFNFCMSCRQYTCANCWNDIEGRCLSCAPASDPEALSQPYGLLEQLIGRPATDPANGNGHTHDALEAGSVNGHVEAPLDPTDVSAWPSMDLPTDEAAEATAYAPVADAPVTEAVEANEMIAEPAVDEQAEPPADLGISAEHFAAMFGSPTPVDAEVGSIGAAAHVGTELTDEQEAVAEPDAIADSAIVAETNAAERAAEAAVESMSPTNQIFEPAVVVEPSADLPAEPLAAGSDASDEAGPVDEALPEGDVDAEPDGIHDLEGWAASAAAQTSTLLDRFRAFPGKRPVSNQPKPVELDSAPLAAAAQADAAGEPLSVDLPTPTIDVVPVIDLFANRRAPKAAPIVAEPVEPAAADAEAEVAVQPEPEPEPMAAATAAVIEPEPVVPETAPASEPVAATPSPLPVAPPVPATPIWQIVAPDAMPPDAIPVPPVAPARTNGRPAWPPLAKAPTAEPQWPTTPAWPTRHQSPTVVSGADAVWAQSSRDLLNRPETGVQACINCGLPLSARARFCRRCGTNQVAGAGPTATA